jgi:hypothetical protein
MRWMQDPEDAPPGRRAEPGPAGRDRWAGVRLRHAWQAWLREWSLFAPRWDGSGDWELV